MSGEQETVIPEKILKHALANQYEVHPKDVKILSSEVSAGSAKGDNYTCMIKKAVVESEFRGETHRDSFIVKAYPTIEYSRKVLQEGCLFSTEVICYTKIFPKLNALAERTSLDGIKIPKCFLADDDDGFIVLEELKDQGFALQDKRKGLDIPHMKIVLDELAKLHALSYHWINNYFGGAERFKKDFWALNGDKWMLTQSSASEALNDEWMGTFFGMFYQVLELHSKDPDLIARLKEFEKCRKERMDAIHAPKGKFVCLIHNDSWCNNFMFRDSADGSPSDVRIIDLQLCRRARPTVDLAYLFGGNLTPAMREKHADELLAYYHNSLKSLLTQLGYKEDLYTLSDLKADYNDCLPFVFLISSMFAQMHLIDNFAEDTSDADSTSSEEAMQKFMEKYAKFQQEQALTNKTLRERMVQSAEEAKRLNAL